MTNYYELYHKHGLPLEEAYYLAGYKYYITKDPIVKDMVKDLCKEICDSFIHHIDEEDGVVCRRYMEEKGFYDIPAPFVFQASCDFYNNYEKPDNLRIRNMVNYLELYKKGLVSLREAYVLAKNKNFLLYDNRMLSMIFAIENEIFKELIEKPVIWSSEQKVDAAKKTLEYITEHLSHKPRTQINGDKPIGRIIELYMNEEGYTYERLASNFFIPIIKL